MTPLSRYAKFTIDIIKMSTFSKIYAGNLYDKYHSSSPLVRFAVKGFLKKIGIALAGISVKTILDCGCADGYISNYIYSLKRPLYMAAADISEDILRKAKRHYAYLDFLNASIFHLPFKNDSFDLVSVFETLEHLNSPEAALKEIRRAGRRYFIFSVPMEPYWHLVNMAAGKYWARLGNTPGHISSWTKKGFLTSLIKNKFLITKDLSTFPWTMILCEKKTA